MHACITERPPCDSGGTLGDRPPFPTALPTNRNDTELASAAVSRVPSHLGQTADLVHDDTVNRRPASSTRTWSYSRPAITTEATSSRRRPPRTPCA